MPLGSAPKTAIDIDYTRAQGSASKGRILFQPPRQKLGTTVLSNFADPVTLIDGKARVELPRLPQGTYRAVEQIDGLAQRWFDFALPLSSPAEVRYEDIMPVVAVPSRHQYVSTINGLAPNPTTGNIVLETGGAANLDELTDVAIASLQDNQALVYSSDDVLWKNVALAAVALAGSYESLTGKPSIPETPEDIGAAALAHVHAMGDITGLVAALATKQARIISRDGYFTPAGDSTVLPNSGGVWAALDGIELSIPAVVGDRLRLGVHGMRNAAGGASLDFGTLTGSSPTLVKTFLATGTSAPAFEGDPGWYVASTFINQSAPRQLVVTSDDIEGGNVRMGLVFKSNGTGIVYRSPNYPLYMLLDNIGPEPS